MSPKYSRKTKTDTTDGKETPLVVYMWALGLGLTGYLVIGRIVLDAQPHPIHWLAGLIGGILGIGVGWLWFRWRGDLR